MNLRRGLFPAFALLTCLLSCVKENGTTVLPDAGQEAWETKVVCLGDRYVQDSFLVKFNDVPSEELLDGCCGGDVLSVQPLFRSFPGKEDLERRFGLDRWYVVSLKEGADLDRSIRAFSALETVAVAEYACIASKASDEVVYPCPETATKAVSGGSFNDPMLEKQWHYNNQGSKAFSNSAVKGADVNVKDVWNRLICGDPDIVVAVVDEGVKFSHPDLKDNMWVNKGEIPGNGLDDDGNGYVDDVYGLNFVTGGPITWDQFHYDENQRRIVGDSGHGTHCAGTIAAVNSNGTGVSGIAGGSGKGDGCRIMSCQIFSGTLANNASAAVTANAIKYAADMGASVISCSFGYTSPFPSDQAYVNRMGSVEIDAIHYFEASKNNPVLDGNIAIFAAGNENQSFAHYPGAFYDIISVSAFAPDFLPTYYTNYGPGCNISAPGGEYGHGVGDQSAILSTLTSERHQTDYGYMQGTSMACPHVSGVVALALSYAKQLGKTFTLQEFKQMIMASVDDIDQRIASAGKKTYVGMQDLNLAPYFHQMGTGAIDAWRLMMHIEGTPSLTATLDQKQWMDLTPVFGTASVSLTYLAVEVPSETVKSLGLQPIEPADDPYYPAVVAEGGYAFVQYGRLYVHPSVVGSGKLRIKAVGGGDHLGGGTNPPGGMELDREVSVIARDADGGNGVGGWL